jgi:DNA-binding response OmpR family regulator
MKVLLADDDPDLIDITTYALRREGYTVLTASDGQQALSRWESDNPDIILMDVGMPRVDGFDACRIIRRDSDTPVILLTARHDEEDIVRGLRLGADDYVTKPFSAKQLVARMSAVLRRSTDGVYREPTKEIRVGEIVLDLQSHEARLGNELVQLTPLEFRIIYILALNEGRVVPYSRLVEYAWGYDGGDSNLLKTHICHLRKKLDLPPGHPGGIRAVPSVGYVLSRS